MALAWIAWTSCEPRRSPAVGSDDSRSRVAWSNDFAVSTTRSPAKWAADMSWARSWLWYPAHPSPPPMMEPSGATSTPK